MNILLHICCSNCALYPVRITRKEGHDFAGFWFNPNIHPHEEHESRLKSLTWLSNDWKFELISEEGYRPEEYFQMFGMSEDEGEAPPFPDRCASCYRLRLEKTAAYARGQGFDAFSTTLLISPYQDFERIISTGKELAEQYNVQFYIKDYRPHFREAMDLSRKLGLYRQKYCGCIFSLEERSRNKQKHRDKGSKAQRHKVKN